MFLLELFLTWSVFCPIAAVVVSRAMGLLLPHVIVATFALWEGPEGGDKEGL